VADASDVDDEIRYLISARNLRANVRLIVGMHDQTTVSSRCPGAAPRFLVTRLKDSAWRASTRPAPSLAVGLLVSEPTIGFQVSENGRFTIDRAGLAGVAGLVLFVTMRRANGRAAVHDQLSGTRVIKRAARAHGPKRTGEVANNVGAGHPLATRASLRTVCRSLGNAHRRRRARGGVRLSAAPSRMDSTGGAADAACGSCTPGCSPDRASALADGKADG